MNAIDLDGHPMARCEGRVFQKIVRRLPIIFIKIKLKCVQDEISLRFNFKSNEENFIVE
jgi:hypothetical protein